jgi:hypothetical protein
LQEGDTMNYKDLKDEINIDGDIFKLNILEDGRYQYTCSKNKRGFKITFTPTGNEEDYKEAQEAMKRFIVNNIL